MQATVHSATINGIQGHLVTVTVATTDGAKTCIIVGLPEAAVRETGIRVRSAVIESGYEWPQKQLEVTLGQPDLYKHNSTAFDLPIALGLLAIVEDWPTPFQAGHVLHDTLVVGELGLSGAVRSVRGVLPMALAAKSAGAQRILCARANANEAELSGLPVYAVEHLREAAAVARGESELRPHRGTAPAVDEDMYRCLSRIKGCAYGKRALEVAAAGGHDLLLGGPPGSGKTMLARCLPGILPPLSEAEQRELTCLFSVAGLLGRDMPVVHRPFRAPHHTISAADLIGRAAHPGEVSLAHLGVLFLDELPEFRQYVLEALVASLEAGAVEFTQRSTGAYPTAAQLVASAQSCPCGHLESAHHPCTCKYEQLSQYRERLESPLHARFDVRISLPDHNYSELQSAPTGETSDLVRERVVEARRRQARRFEDTRRTNATLTPNELRRYCEPDEAGHRLINEAVNWSNASASQVARSLRVARTIADLTGCPDVRWAHLAEAMVLSGLRSFRPRDTAQEVTGAP